MVTHTVKGLISYRFEVEVAIDPAKVAEFGVAELLEAVGARDGFHFGDLAFGEDDIWVHDADAEVSVSSVEPGGIEWVDDGLPYAGVTDGEGGVIWQED